MWSNIGLGHSLFMQVSRCALTWGMLGKISVIVCHENCSVCSELVFVAEGGKGDDGPILYSWAPYDVHSIQSDSLQYLIDTQRSGRRGRPDSNQKLLC